MLSASGEAGTAPSGEESRAVRLARRREKRRLRSERAEWWSTKLHALLWVVGAIVAFFVSDFLNVCLNSNDIVRGVFNVGAVLFGAVVLAIIRMALWFPKQGEGVEADFERAHPKFVLATTFGGVFSFLFLTIGIWPVYRIFAPFLLGLFWFGMVMFLHFLP